MVLSQGGFLRYKPARTAAEALADDSRKSVAQARRAARRIARLIARNAAAIEAARRGLA